MSRQSGTAGTRHAVLVAICASVLAMPVLAFGQEAASGTLDRIRGAGRIRLGYRADIRPFSHLDEKGQPAGYSIALCEHIVSAVKAQSGLGGIAVEWVPVTADSRFQAVARGDVDLLCGAETATLSRRATVSFSIPIFQGGTGVLVRADAPARLREVLAGGGPTGHPTWRASAARTLQARAFSAVRGTTSERWLSERLRDLEVVAEVSRVDGYDAGVQALLERRSDALFGERAVLLDLARQREADRDLTVVDHQFTFEPLALALRKGDDDFRLLVDEALSRLYSTLDVIPIYSRWFSDPDATTLRFFRSSALPE
jgi:polar amino acid transport system substrate-binding protein